MKERIRRIGTPVNWVGVLIWFISLSEIFWAEEKPFIVTFISAFTLAVIGTTLFGLGRK